MHRVGLVGVGKMGVSHLAIVNAHPDLELAGVCDSQGFVLAAARSQLGIETYRDLERMFDEAGLDAVIVSTPTSSHAPIARQAIERGIAVFVEKPLTLLAADSSELADLADKQGVATQVGYHNRFIGTFREVRRLVQAGAIGEIHHVDGRAFGQVVTADRGGGRTWRSKKAEGGGCLHDYACHVLDLMNFVAGPPDTVLGASLGRVHSTAVEDTVDALLRYPSGATGTLETNWSDQSQRKMTTSITVHGSRGSVHADRQECRLFLAPGQSFEGMDPGWTVRYITELQDPVRYYLRGEEYSAQVDAFAAALAGRGDPAASTFATAAEVDRLVEEIARVDAEGPRAASAHATPSGAALTRIELLAEARAHAADAGRRAVARVTAAASRLRERMR